MERNIALVELLVYSIHNASHPKTAGVSHAGWLKLPGDVDNQGVNGKVIKLSCYVFFCET